MSRFTLPPLGYPFDALEPNIDERTMRIHYLKHHQTYINHLNAALERHPELMEKSLTELLSDLRAIPEDIRTDVRNNGGGHYNHSLLWKILTPGGSNRPVGLLKQAIDRELNGYDSFRAVFSRAAAEQFGSGWAWLVVDEDDRLQVTRMANQDNPVMVGKTPILGIDVWEHAYYLKYQNRRAEYIDHFIPLINWDVVAGKYEQVLKQFS
ncbi:superoxide dismutase [Sporolactobacillus sp. THM7-7]|nr:superoxide dismutase [Sporolactobacillus sp. THM7-7]